MRRGKRKIKTSLLALSIGPLVGFGLAALMITSGIIYNSLESEVEYGLKVLLHTAYEAYDLGYPGDYNMQDGVVRKGDMILSQQEKIVDGIKERTGADATLFYGSVRSLTTIKNPDGTRAVGSEADDEVVETVLINGEEYFSDDVLVNGVQYFGYYMPLTNENGTIAGMAFVGKPRREVMEKIERNIFIVCILALGTLAIVIVIVSHFSRSLIYSLNKTEQFLGKIAEGDLTAKIDPYVLERQDELGEMGRFAVVLQESIVDLVGRDPLTGLSNRRSCDIVLKSLEKTNCRRGTAFTIVMSDIDFFKKVNDTYGHQAGDEILKNIAELMKEHMEHLGFVFRWGGEEFLLIYEDMGEQETTEYLRKLQSQIHSSETLWNGKKIKITMTFGMAEFDEDKSPEELIQLADEHLYYGKKTGRDKIVGVAEGREIQS